MNKESKISENLRQIRSEIKNAQLIVVTKNRPNDEVIKVYNEGERCFAENRVQELVRKREEFPADVEWHLIGHLQTNKVKSIIPWVKLIHSADSLKLLKNIEKESAKHDVQTSVLLQVKVSEDDSKFGFDPKELIALTTDGTLSKFKHTQFKGVMSMTSLGVSDEKKLEEFRLTSDIFQQLKPIVPNPNQFQEISMGMSDDYLLGIKAGSTLVRIGSKIFA